MKEAESESSVRRAPVRKSPVWQGRGSEVTTKGSFVSRSHEDNIMCRNAAQLERVDSPAIRANSEIDLKLSTPPSYMACGLQGDMCFVTDCERFKRKNNAKVNVQYLNTT